MHNCIGFFDSGVGGISVLHTAHHILPNENFLYYGDNGNAPYGPKPVGKIRELCARSCDFILSHGVKALVIACNTATSVYAESLRSELDIPIIGMEPALKPAQLARTDGDVLVLATKATLSLPKFQRLMQLYGENAIPIVGEGLVELVEKGRANTPEADNAVYRLLAPHLSRKIDSIVLGCTHYPFLKSSVRKVLPGVSIFDGRTGTVMQLRRLLEMHNLLSADGSAGQIEFHTSGSPDTIRLMKQLMRSLDETEPTASL